MSRATMSYYALYTFDDTVFDELQLPAGVDRDTIIENFIADSIELETLYSDPETFKAMLGIWSRKRLDTWNAYYKILNDTEYNPIWNVDGVITSTYGERKTELNSDPVTSNENLGNTHAVSKIGERVSETANKVSAYNSEELSNAGAVEAKQNSATDESTTDAVDNTYTTGKQHSDSTQKEVIDTIKRQGNVGVTTTQHMMLEELDLRDRHNLYEYIVKDMIKRFCILVY